MAWKRLTYSDMKLYLSQDELEKLNTYSTDISAIINDELDVVSDAFRGSFLGKGYRLDIRDHYTPASYKHFILAYARWSVWTRFPMAEQFALTEPRKTEYEYAQKLLENPTIGVEKPDYSDDPELSGRTDLSVIDDSALTLPYQRILSYPGQYGFINPYVKNYQTSLY